MRKLLVLTLACLMMVSLLPAGGGGLLAVSAQEETILNLATDPSVVFTGTWKKSDKIANYDGGPTLYPEGNGSFEAPVSLEKGNYELFFYKCVHVNNIKNMKLNVYHGGSLSESPVLDLSAGTDEWVSLGIYDFAGSGAEKVAFTAPSGGLASRASALKFVKTDQAPTVDGKPVPAATPKPSPGATPAPSAVPIPGEAPDYGLPSADYQLLYEDGFDAEGLDLDAWQYRTGAKYGGQDLPENVSVSNGNLVLGYHKVDGQYTGGGVITNFNLPYGYYEARCRTFGGTGALHSSFWSSGGVAGDGVRSPLKNLVIEIDGFEIDSEKPNSISSGYFNWVYDTISYPRNYHTSVDTSADYFTLGYEWLPDRIVWYVNGQRVKEDKNPTCYAPQNLWLTAVAMPEKKLHLIDDSKLGGATLFDYVKYYQRPLKGANLLGNGDFEYNLPYGAAGAWRDMQVPHNYIETGDVAASRVVKNANAYSEDCFLYLNDPDKEFHVFTNQRFEYLLNGSYTLGAWIKSSGGQKTARLAAMDRSGRLVKALDVPETGGQWVYYALKDIPVTDNYLQVGFECEGAAGQWMMIDKAEFYNQDGTDEYNRKEAEYRYPAEDGDYPGETVLPHAQAEIVGDWKVSSAMPESLWLDGDDPDASVTWHMPVTAGQEIVLQMYNNVYAGSNPKAQVAIECEGKTDIVFVDQTGEKSGWVTLGAYLPATDSPITVKLSSGGQTGYTRANKIRSVPKADFEFTESTALVLHSHIAFSKNKYVAIDPANPEVVPFTKDDRTLVPLRFIAERLGAQVGYEEGLVTITQPGTTLSLEIGKDILWKNGEEIKLDVPAETYNDRTFVPLRAISEAFGKQVAWDDAGVIILTDSPYQLTPAHAQEIIEKINAQDGF